MIGSYRKIIDAYYKGNLTEKVLKREKDILSRVANRETSSQYFNHEASEKDQYYSGRIEISNQDYLGQVISYDTNKKWIKIYERNYFKIGDLVELFTPNGENIAFTVTELFTEEEIPCDIARHPDNIYYIYLDTNIEIVEYSMLRLLKKKTENIDS